jgi:hypothetical protein
MFMQVFIKEFYKLTEMEAYFLDTRLCESVIFLNTVEHFAETPVTIRFSIVELLGC